MRIKLFTHTLNADSTVASTTTQEIDSNECDSLLVSLGLTFISSNVLPRFLDRSKGNRFAVESNGAEYVFTSAE